MAIKNKLLILFAGALFCVIHASDQSMVQVEVEGVTYAVSRKLACLSNTIANLLSEHSQKHQAIPLRGVDTYSFKKLFGEDGVSGHLASLQAIVEAEISDSEECLEVLAVLTAEIGPSIHEHVALYQAINYLDIPLLLQVQAWCLALPQLREDRKQFWKIVACDTQNTSTDQLSYQREDDYIAPELFAEIVAELSPRHLVKRFACYSGPEVPPRFVVHPDGPDVDEGCPEVPFTARIWAQGGWGVPVAVSRDGTRVFAGSVDNVVCVFDLSANQQIDQLAGHDDWVHALAVHPRGDLLIAGSNDKTMGVFDVNTHRMVHKLEGHSGYIWAVATHVNGDCAISGSNDRTIAVWDLETGSMTRRFQEWGQVWSLVTHPDGNRLLSGTGTQGQISTWDLRAGTCSQRLDADAGWIWSIALHPDQNQVVVGGNDALSVYDLRMNLPGEKLGQYEQTFAVAIHRDGKQVIASSGHGLWAWDLTSRAATKKVGGHSRNVRSLAMHPEEDLVISGASDMAVGVWALDPVTYYRGHHLDAQARMISDLRGDFT